MTTPPSLVNQRIELEAGMPSLVIQLRTGLPQVLGAPRHLGIFGSAFDLGMKERHRFCGESKSVPQAREEEQRPGN